MTKTAERSPQMGRHVLSGPSDDGSSRQAAGPLGSTLYAAALLTVLRARYPHLVFTVTENDRKPLRNRAAA